MQEINIDEFKMPNIVSIASVCHLQKYGKIAVITMGSVLIRYQPVGSNIIFKIPNFHLVMKTAFIVSSGNGNLYSGFAFNDGNYLSIQIDNLPANNELYITGEIVCVLI